MESIKFKWWHLATIAISTVIGLSYAGLKPTWWDEMHYVDPGMHFALQGRMFSTTWVTNSPHELWASGNPGLPLLFAGWFKIFGFGFVQSRALFFFLYFSGVIVFFFWIRNKFNPTAWALVLGISGSFILPSLAEPIINLRLDVLAYLFFTLFLYYTWTDKENIFLNWVAPVLLGLLTAFFGLHFSMYFVLAAGVTILLKRNKVSFIRAIALGAGTILGMIILWAVYKKLGMWDTFIASRASHIGKQLPWCPAGFKKLTLLKDWWVFMALAVMGFLGNLRQNRSQWLPWVLAITAFFAIPYVISVLGIYYRPYIWMVTLPMILCFYHSENSLKGWYLKISIILLSFSLVDSGLYKIRHTHESYKIKQHQDRVLKMVHERFPEGTSIIANSNFYYDLTSHRFTVYPNMDPDAGTMLGYKQDYFFPKDLRNQVKCIIITTKEMKKYPTIFTIASGWTQSGKFSGPSKEDPTNEINIFVREY
jgi:hypothetical protein